MEVSLSNDDIKCLVCALTLYMENMHLAMQVKNNDLAFVPDVIFKRHIELLSKFHDLQNRLLDILKDD